MKFIFVPDAVSLCQFFADGEQRIADSLSLAFDDGGLPAAPARSSGVENRINTFRLVRIMKDHLICSKFMKDIDPKIDSVGELRRAGEGFVANERVCFQKMMGVNLRNGKRKS